MRWLAFYKYSFWPTNIKILYVTNSEIRARTVDIQSYQSPLMYCIKMTSLSRSINSITKLFVLPVYHNTFDHIYVVRYCLYICRSPLALRIQLTYHRYSWLPLMTRSIVCKPCHFLAASSLYLPTVFHLCDSMWVLCLCLFQSLDIFQPLY